MIGGVTNALDGALTDHNSNNLHSTRPSHVRTIRAAKALVNHTSASRFQNPLISLLLKRRVTGVEKMERGADLVQAEQDAVPRGSYKLKKLDAQLDDRQ